MRSSLEAHLRAFAGEDPLRNDIAEAVRQLGVAAIKLRGVIMEEPAGPPAPTPAATNAAGDIQTWLDIEADRIFTAAAWQANIAIMASEERAEPLPMHPGGTLALAIDPLDGSSNIETNASIGSIFSLLPAAGQAPFAQPGRNQLAAGTIVYGPRCQMILTLGRGTLVFTYSPSFGGFVEEQRAAPIPEKTSEFAINASNYRHWDEEMRLYVDDCLAGADGPRGREFNMRWTASLVAEVSRILARGGVFLYPADARRPYREGRLRQLYEANPVAFIVEQAGGAATDGIRPLLDTAPATLHQRTPFVFGSAHEVQRVARYLTDPSAIGERSPLFGRRSLFRA
ncbi:class 1 fructose-bisphosphatase [Aureimonas altamirensis]|uniref:class 1 fructose-bisphosphatase n=1 Tax=Aureimonas altamirensis TaxID=370622 RepID=UPI003B97094B